MLSKVGTAGQPIRDHTGKQVQTPKSKKKLKCIGGFQEPESLDSLISAIALVHKNTHGLTGDYRTKCIDCENEFKTNRSGCKHHANDPRPIRSGCVTNSAAVRDTLSHIKHSSTHAITPACQLLPSDLRDVRDYCISKNSAYYLGIYALQLLAIDLAFRKTEYTHLTEQSFNQEMTVMSGEYIVEALNIKARTKKKNRRRHRTHGDQDGSLRYLYAWGDDQCPDLDVKRHLFAFWYSINWQGGTLFPSEEEINNPPPDYIYKTFISEDELYSVLKELFRDVLQREDKLTSHSSRKSYYLLGTMRGGKPEELMVGAGHDDVSTAMKYYQDAGAIANVTSIFMDPKQAVGTWKNPHCEGAETAKRAAYPGRQWQKPLPELVAGFIEKVVGVSPTDPRRRFPKYLAEKVARWKHCPSPMADLQANLEHISKDRTRDIIASVVQIKIASEEKGRRRGMSDAKAAADAYLAQCLRQLKHHLEHNGVDVATLQLDSFLSGTTSGSLLASSHAAHAPNPDDPSTFSYRPHKRRKTKVHKGEKTIEGLSGFRSLKLATEKLQFIVEHYDDNHSDYQNNARLWLIRQAPIYRCLIHHCNSSIPTFLSKHGKEPDKLNFAVGDFAGDKKYLSRCSACQSAAGS